MSSSGRRLAVRVDEAVWREAVRGFSRGPLQIATSARRVVERDGLALADVRPCEALGPDGTQLAGCAKVYLPLGDGPPSERPMAFVLRLAREPSGTLVWVFVAFGHRHPGPGVRSVYERAHRQLHGHFPEHDAG
jgi:hypothetical protein